MNMEEEQEGCIQKSSGCQLTIDAIVLKHAHEKQYNVHICYVHYQEAFDTVPHSCLMKVLEVYKTCPKIRFVLQLIMRTRRTNMWVNQKNAGTVINEQFSEGICFLHYGSAWL
jgi:dimeric dUTPase (all-alpha-NTP-PPase superfamily)